MKSSWWKERRLEFKERGLQDTLRYVHPKWIRTTPKRQDCSWEHVPVTDTHSPFTYGNHDLRKPLLPRDLGDRILLICHCLVELQEQ